MRNQLLCVMNVREESERPYKKNDSTLKREVKLRELR